MVRQLQPWFENIKKRQVKSPKVYYRDSGLLHYQLGIRSYRDLLGHPKVGASWEGFVIEQALKHFQPEEEYFWSTQSDAELDLLLIKDGKRMGVECKLTDSPKATRSMHKALEILGLESLKVVHTGKKSYPLGERIEAISIRELL
jgi:predicted AAA+ superfamily ATPase